MNRDEALAQLTAPGGPYELQTITGEFGPLKAFVTGPATLKDLYRETISDQTFIMYEGEHLTFAEAHLATAQIAHLLVNELGVSHGDRVAISMRNYPEWMLAFAAITSIGAIAVAMNALWTAEEMEYGLTNSGTKVLFADQERLDRFAQCPGSPQVQLVAVRPTRPIPGALDLAAAMKTLGPVEMPEVEVSPTDPATILYTSGSTGHPKGVVSSHRNIISALMSWEVDIASQVLAAQSVDQASEQPVPGAQPASQPSVLLAVPLFHVLGLHAVFLMCYRAQRKLISMYKWDPSLAAEIIERERIATFVGPPAMTGDLVREAQNSSRDLSSLLTVGGGGAARAPEQVRQIDAVFSQAIPNTGWGMTETNAIGTTINGADYLARPDSAGRCLAVLEMRVVDDINTPVAPGERGELQIRGTSMFSGYWNRPEVNAEVFVDGDWFRTGDVATIDTDGYLYIVDRIKDLIIRGGENIGCGHVEAALLMHPDVYEAAVYAVPDERLGEEVATTIYAHRDLDTDQLREFLNSHLARYEVPRYIFVHDGPLPRTGSGKLFKRELRELAVAAATRK
jgi:long-chain acyl-CoA synthetase